MQRVSACLLASAGANASPTASCIARPLGAASDEFHQGPPQIRMASRASGLSGAPPPAFGTVALTTGADSQSKGESTDRKVMLALRVPSSHCGGSELGRSGSREGERGRSRMLPGGADSSYHQRPPYALAEPADAGPYSTIVFPWSWCRAKPVTPSTYQPSGKKILHQQ